MRFGTIGAGEVALAFGREALARGHEVVLSSRRGPDALVDKVAELGHGASAASVEEAASLDYVLLAVPWRNVESALKSLPAWNGRVLIDATNPFVETSPKLVLADLGGKGASEVVAAMAPGARIVKAFNSIVTARFNEGPVKNGGRRVIFVSGDHPEPTAFIKQLIESFGFTAVDLGLSIATNPPSLNLRVVRQNAETHAIRQALVRAGGNISRTAEMLGVTRPTLYDLMAKYGIRTEEADPSTPSAGANTQQSP
jgi:Predicted dinucleotide-binding enzymes